MIYLDLTETEKAYLAGLFDGEGSIGLYTRKDRICTPDFRITNSDFRLGWWIRKKLPFGSFKIYDRPNRKTMWEWEIRGRKQVRLVCDVIKPYLIVKLDQVTLLLDLLDAEQDAGCGAGQKVPEHIHLLRAEVNTKLRVMKTQDTINIH